MVNFILFLLPLVLIGGLSVLVGVLGSKLASIREDYRHLTLELDEQLTQNKAHAVDLRRLLHQKKSSEVRTGQIAEQMAPFLDGCPYPPKQASFLGRPIDFVVFGDEGVHFVEVKSGKAQLSTTQRKIRDQITAGKVTFEVYKVQGE